MVGGHHHGLIIAQQLQIAVTECMCFEAGLSAQVCLRWERELKIKIKQPPVLVSSDKRPPGSSGHCTIL